MTMAASFTSEIPRRDFGDALERVSAENVVLLELRVEALERRVRCLVFERDALIRDAKIKKENPPRVQPTTLGVKSPSGYWW